jgi:hypothetical protein
VHEATAALRRGEAASARVGKVAAARGGEAAEALSGEAAAAAAARGRGRGGGSPTSIASVQVALQATSADSLRWESPAARTGRRRAPRCGGTCGCLLPKRWAPGCL